MKLSDGQRRLVAGVALFLLVTSLLALVAAGGGKYGISESVVEALGFGEFQSLVAAYGLGGLAVALALGKLVSMNKTDEERHGLNEQ
ncbi:hypothetical protein [Haloarchaeobius amylolyticus]|uniref:hypothetical protein n=1 Tax=Haloarchaeobius amylolyticus TaxID=1198296 RepID=UPI002271B3C2|nr:hypothetical protein [Haloarchaeobius amylolyticus]